MSSVRPSAPRRRSGRRDGTRPQGRVLMVQGTASFVGKSVLVAALCRLFAREGLRVAPFKAQNISLNAAVTASGGEIGVAQAVQARAAGEPPAVEHNPVLVKPEGPDRAQVVVLGRAMRPAPPRAALWRAITRSLDTLRTRCDLVVIEGAGSPAEINLRRTDLANMRVARYARAPVVLVGDIDRGGVFAALTGTLALLDRAERALIRGVVLNKFRGTPARLRAGIVALEARLRRPVLGVIPYAAACRLPEEDGVGLEDRAALPGGTRTGALEIAVVCLPYISNFDEFHALEREPGVRVRYVRGLRREPGRPGDALGGADLVILPGSKATIADLTLLWRSGLADAVRAAAAGGTPVLGLCGGYQMLGMRVDDPEGLESPRPSAEGLGLLPVRTTFAGPKRTARVRVRIAAGLPRLDAGNTPGGGGFFVELAWALDGRSPTEAEGYEIHQGRTTSSGPPLLRITARGGAACDEPEGAVSRDGWVAGTSVHGLFGHAPFRHAVLDALRARRGIAAGRAHGPGAGVARRTDEAGDLDAALDALADHVSRHLDLDRLRAIIGLRTAAEPSRGGGRPPRNKPVAHGVHRGRHRSRLRRSR